MSDPFTAKSRLCQDGTVVDGPMFHGKPYPCTGHAHFQGHHIRCTDPIHGGAEGWRDPTWLAEFIGRPVDAPDVITPMSDGKQRIAKTRWRYDCCGYVSVLPDPVQPFPVCPGCGAQVTFISRQDAE